jgi:hypothetical protein
MSEKRRFQQFFSRKVRKTARFSPYSYISGGFFDFYDPLHHHPWTGLSPRQ